MPHPGGEDISRGLRRAGNINQACVTVTSNSVTFNNCSDSEAGYNVTLNGSITGTANSVWTMNSPANPGGGWESATRNDATIVALDSVVVNPLVLPVALAADAVLLCVEVGKTAPEIDGEDLDSKPFKLSDYRGKVVVLDFWGHW